MDDKMSVNLPVSFDIKYIGSSPAKGLWGIKHTRGPVDFLVKEAKSLPQNAVIPIVRVQVNTEGLSFHYLYTENKEITTYKVDCISYGVQDIVYTRVFSMIVVQEGDLKVVQHPFTCHAFVCDSRSQARKLTYALAKTFEMYGNRMKESGEDLLPKKRFAIDLRQPEEMQNASDEEETDA